MKRAVRQFLGFCTLFLAIPARADQAAIHINVDQTGPSVNPRMYGIFLEEINHGVDDGLYGELIRNRGFEDGRAPEGYDVSSGRWVDGAGFAVSRADMAWSPERNARGHR